MVSNRKSSYFYYNACLCFVFRIIIFVIFLPMFSYSIQITEKTRCFKVAIFRFPLWFSFNFLSVVSEYDLRFHTWYLTTTRCIRVWRGVHKLAKDGMLDDRLAIVISGHLVEWVRWQATLMKTYGLLLNMVGMCSGWMRMHWKMKLMHPSVKTTGTGRFLKFFYMVILVKFDVVIMWNLSCYLGCLFLFLGCGYSLAFLFFLLFN